jgi:ribosomal protein RSM22 (predicted rRNA methylase)
MFDWQHEAEIQASRYGTERMKGAIESLSEAYRAGRSTAAPRLDDGLLVAAYLAVRFPATQAANLAVNRQIEDALASRAADTAFEPESLLDLGAGCGAATLAAKAVWPTLNTLTAVEPMTAMVELGRQMVPEATWRTLRFEQSSEFGVHDVVVSSYAMGEGRADTLFVDKAWKAAGKLLILIEPGTPRGFAGILAARQRLIELGASLLAPCPNALACPTKDLDWCHFATRLNRTALHRRLKGGTIGWEDEKFSYVAAWRGPLGEGVPRVLRHPLIQPGRIEVELCTAPSRRRVVTTKRNKDRFRIARKLGWGDVLAIDPHAGPELSARDDGESEGA